MTLDIGGKTPRPKNPRVRVASDGYPVPMDARQQWRGICTVCYSPTATLTVTKRSTYKVSCASCKCYVWLNDKVSIDLWRASQALFKKSPEIRELLVTQVTECLPND